VNAANWLTVFPARMDIGIYNRERQRTRTGSIGTETPRDRTLKIFLNAFDGGGTNMPIPQDFINPINSFGSGTISRMTAVLRLNIAFNAAGFLGSPVPGFGNLIYVNPLSSLNGFTVNQILALCDSLLATGGPIPPGYNFTNFTDLLEDLAASFTNCVPSGPACSSTQIHDEIERGLLPTPNEAAAEIPGGPYQDPAVRDRGAPGGSR
jgi:hypothetical protein